MGKGIAMTNKKIEGIIAEFKNPAELIQTAEKLRDSEYKNFDCHSPFPIHGMDKAMGEKRSPLGWIVGIVAFLGLSAGVTLEWWTSTVDYPLVISGKPFFSYQRIADEFGYKARQNINNYVREYEACDENLFDYLRHKRKVDPVVVEAVREELGRDVLVKSAELRIRVNARLGRED